MAQFSDVMRQARRMCKAYSDCGKCELYWSSTGGGCAFGYISSDSRVSFDEVERKIRAWMADHPEPTYPSWEDGWKQLFPDAECVPCPDHCFGDDSRCERYDGCKQCKASPMPAKIAEKLGIKPKEAK